MLWILLTVFRLFPIPAPPPFGEVAFAWRLAGHQSCGKLYMIAFALLLLFFVVGVVFNSSFFHLQNCLTHKFSCIFVLPFMSVDRSEQVALWGLVSGWG